MKAETTAGVMDFFTVPGFRSPGRGRVVAALLLEGVRDFGRRIVFGVAAPRHDLPRAAGSCGAQVDLQVLPVDASAVGFAGRTEAAAELRQSIAGLEPFKIARIVGDVFEPDHADPLERVFGL